MADEAAKRGKETFGTGGDEAMEAMYSTLGFCDTHGT